MWKRRALVIIALAIIGWSLWAATFDRKGGFAPTADPGVVVDRVGGRIGLVAKKTKKTVKRTDRALNKGKKRGSKTVRKYKREMAKVK